MVGVDGDSDDDLDTKEFREQFKMELYWSIIAARVDTKLQWDKLYEDDVIE